MKQTLLLFLLLTSATPFLSNTLSALGTNDNCDSAISLLCGETFIGSTIGDTDSGNNPAADEFFTFTGDGVENIITLSLCDDGTDYDSFLRVFTDCTLTTEIVSNDDFCGLQSQLEFTSDGVSTYYIMVEGFAANEGNFSLEVSCLDTSTNDGCDFATPIACGETIAGDTTDDTDSGANESADEFFVFQANGFEEDVTISLCNGATNYDSFIRVYASCALNNEIASNDDSCGLQSELTFTVEGTNEYFIMIEGYQANTGAFEITLTCSGPPELPPNDAIENAINIGDNAFDFTDPNVLTQNATAEGGNTQDCSLNGFEGVWYVFETTNGGGTVNAVIETPSGVQSVIFFEAPTLNATVTDLTRVAQDTNPCFTGNTASIDAEANKIYYIFVTNMGASTNINIDLLTLGINEDAISNFKLFPNPAISNVTLSANKIIENIIIYNLQGQVVFNTTAASYSKELNVSFLPTGSYLLEITTDGVKQVRKLVKK